MGPTTHDSTVGIGEKVGLEVLGGGLPIRVCEAVRQRISARGTPSTTS